LRRERSMRPIDVPPNDANAEDPRSHGGLSHRGLLAAALTAERDGRFARMFPWLRPLTPTLADSRALAGTMTQDLENSQIPAGYTYFGQFIDHDITYDPASRSQRLLDPDALVDFRAPRLDLDTLYGGGPAVSAFLYDDDRMHLRMGTLTYQDDNGNLYEEIDLPRVVTRPTQRTTALVPDARNDENIILSQLHLLFIRYHNCVVNELVRSRVGNPIDQDSIFDEAVRIVRWHYQWIVMHDYLQRIVPAGVLNDVLVLDRTRSGVGPQIRRSFFQWTSRPFIPVEFSGAAFRFGHSMIRASYMLNDVRQYITPFPLEGDDISLRGLDARPKDTQVLWSVFFDVPGSGGIPQMASKINTSIAPSLQKIPVPHISLNLDAGISTPFHRQFLRDAVAGGGEQSVSLGERDIVRGLALGLPSGQDVARAMGLASNRILTPRDLAIGHAKGQMPPLFLHSTPLWYYVLKEADKFGKGEKLGPVGGRIVAEVVLGLLESDPSSFLRVRPAWRPEAKFGASLKEFPFLTMGSLVAYVESKEARRAARAAAGVPRVREAARPAAAAEP
jgi:hypothetical protein